MLTLLVETKIEGRPGSRAAGAGQLDTRPAARPVGPALGRRSRGGSTLCSACQPSHLIR